MQREEQNEFRRAGEVPSVLSALGCPAQNNINNSQTTQRLPATGEPPLVATAEGDPVQSSQNSGVSQKKEVERIEFDTFPNSNSFVILEDELEECSVLQRSRRNFCVHQ